MNRFTWLGVLITILIGIGIAIGLPFNDSKTLCWDWPTTNTDGSPLTDLAGAKLYWSDVSGAYLDITSKDVGMAIPEGTTGACYVVTEPLNGKYYFSVTAYDASGNESAFSNEVSKIFIKWLRPSTNLRWK